MTIQNHPTHIQRIARMTGLSYIGIVFSGIFAEFFVRMSLVQPNDPAKTLQNIAASEGLFRAGLAADAVMIALDVCVAVGLYFLLRQVSRPLALLAAALRLVQASILGANLMNMGSALKWATADAVTMGVEPIVVQRLVLSSMDVHRIVYDLGLIFFGLACLVLGHLIRTSRLLPPVLGIGLSLSGMIYLLGSFAVILAPEVATTLDPMYGLTVLAELAVAGWLTFKGVRISEGAPSAAAPKSAILASALVLSLSGCASDDVSGDANPSPEDEKSLEEGTTDTGTTWGEFGDRGGHAVGHRTFKESDAGLLIQAWYPSEGEEETKEYEVTFQAEYYGAPTGVILGRAAQDAPLVRGDEALPVVVFSHGFSLNPEWYSTLTEHLASQGFVVLAPEHPEGDWDATVVDATFDRPEKVRQTIDWAEQLNREGDWAAGLDLTRIAVVGHSYGGYTALASAGARFDTDALAEACADLHPMDPKTFLCAPFLSDPEVVERLEGAAEGSASPLLDERIAAVVSIAGDAYLFGESGLSSVTVPTLAIGGTGDNYSPWDWGAELTFDSISSERAALVGLEGADHMIAVNTCDNLPWTNTLPEEFSAVLCQDPAWERDAALVVVQEFTTAFLFDHLKGDPGAHDMLSRDAVRKEGVRYEATW